MRTITTIFAFIFLALSNIVAQSFETANVRSTASGSIPSDNTLRYYRLAIPVTRSAYVEDLGEDYDNVLQFWRECEEFANRMFVPLGICFDVVEDQRLVKTAYFPNEEGESFFYTLQANGTTNTNDLIGADSYDVAMWVYHRDIDAENSGLSAEGGVYSDIAKGNGYSKTDKWVVTHELGHMFGAPHTTTGEGSLMDSGGDDFFSYPSIKMIRDLAVERGAGSANNAVNVSNSAPVFDNENMKDSYRIPQGACIAIPVYANDADGNMLTYSAIGCSSSTVGNVIEGGVMPHFASLIPQTSNVIDYRPKFTADIFYDDFYYEKSGTNIPAMNAGSYNIAILVNDVPASMEYDYLTANPFYSNYAVWDATVQIVGGTSFSASMSPAKNSYSAGEQVTVSWGVNSNYFTADSRLRITMSTDYGKTFAYVLADNVPALDGSKAVTLPDVNVGNIDVDFKTATRSKRGGIIRVEEIGGVAYTLTTLDPTDGKDFNITGGSGAPITYTISVTAGDGGTASIGGKSSTTVTAGSSVTLTATPNDGYRFDCWYCGESFVSLQAEYTFIPTASGTYNALFEEEAGTPVTYKITATANPIEGGTVTGGGTYNEDETVTLTANANNGYNFTGWYNGQDLVSNENPYTFIAKANGTYNALFEKEAGTPVTYKISATANPIEGGTVTGGGTYNEGATVTLTATPNSGYEFVNWTSGGKEVTTQANYTIYNVTGDADYVANFKEDGSGSDPQPSTGLGGKWYRIKDNASGKYIDINKDGATGNSHGNVIMSDKDEDSKRQIIYFETSGDGYKLKAATGDYIKCEQWNVSAGDANSAATLIFEETGDFYYIKWNHTYYQNNIYYFKVENAKGGDYALHPYDDAASTSIAAIWTLEEVKYTISVSASEGGTAEVATGGGGGAASVEVPYDGSATLTATPASGFKFVNWTKGGTPFSEEAELTVNNIQANAEYVANFERITYTVNVNANPIEGGNVTGGGTYNEGETVTLTANANNGYNFTGWYNGQDLVSNENPYTFVLEGNINYEARFEVAAPVTYTITARANPEEAGSVTGGGIYNEGATVTLTATPNSGYEFVNWTSGTTTVSTDATYSFTANASAEYIANFQTAAPTTFAVTTKANPAAGGTATFAVGTSPEKTSATVASGTGVTLYAVANDGYKFVNWTKGGMEVSTNATHNVTITEASDFVANFEEEVQDGLTTGYYHIVSRATSSHEYLYNNALRTNNSQEFTLQSDSKITTNNGIWYITVNSNQLGVKNGDGNALVTGAAYCGDATSHNTLNIEKTTDVDDVTYYSFVEGINCTNRSQYNFTLEGGKYVSDTDNNYVTTWTGHPDAEANQWRLERVDTDGKNIYDVVVECTENDVYVTYGSEYAFDGGFFITNETITAQQLTANKNNAAVQDVTVLVEGKTIRVVDTEYVDITVSTTPAESGSVTINGEATGTKSVIKGSSVTLNATPAKGYRFLNWSDAKGSIVSETAEYTFKPTESGEYFANFMRTYTIQIRTNSAEAGSATVNGSTSSVTIDYGASITLVATPKDSCECEFMGWEKDGVRVAGVGITNPYTIYGITDDATYTAIFSRITEYTQLEDGVAYNIRGRMENGSYGYVYCDGTNLKYSIMDEGEDELSSDRYIFVVQKTDDKKVNLISALGYYGWNQNGTLSNEYAKIEIANGIGMEGRTLYSATGTDFYTFSTYGKENIKATKDDAINKSVAGDVTSDFDFVEATDYKFKVSVAEGSNAKLGTINLPFATKLPDSITAYKAKVQDDDLVMTELELTDNILPANTPVLIEGTSSGKYGFAPAPASKETYDTGFSGTLDAKDIDSNVKAYILSYNGEGTEIKFYKLSSTSRKINANKAYFEDSTGSSATAFRIRFAGVTGIDGIEEENEMHESVYDLQGRKLEKVTSPGIYIVDGKKKYIK